MIHSAKRDPATALTLALALVACRGAEPAGEVPRPSSAPAPAPAPAPDPGGLSDAEWAEAQDFIDRYRRFEVDRPTADPRARLVNPRDAPCRPLPSARPPGFEITLERYGYDPEDTTTYGIAAEGCTFEWPHFHLDPGPLDCTLLGPAELDALYGELAALALDRVEVEHLEGASPHRGGESLTLRWEGARCWIADHDEFKVSAAARPRFERATALVAAAIRGARTPAEEAPKR